MKKNYNKGTNKYAVFALLSVLLISLGYLSIQGNIEGMKNKKGMEMI
jgi:hypothetical protein